MTGDTGLFARALSVVDIALWDLLGKLMNAPLWRVWGGAIQVGAVCGHLRLLPV